MRAAIYARVSTANNGQDPMMQIRELREYCERFSQRIDLPVSVDSDRNCLAELILYAL
jgi:DNA invertase Pin-like site-specific DNA recombinase